MSQNDPWDRDNGDNGDGLEAEIMRADHPFGVAMRGTTAEEALAGLSLDQALARERPDGRTIEEVLAVLDDGVPDIVGQLIAEASLVRDDFASPEEAALSIHGDASSATDHEDRHAWG